MEFLFAIIVIAAIAAFIYKMSRVPQRPHFSAEQQVSKKAVLSRLVELSKSCSAVERGRGIDFDSIFDNLESGIENINEKMNFGKNVALWEKMLCDSSGSLRSAIELGRQKLILSKCLGHVNGVPRLFLFCDALVGLTCGDFDKTLLKSAVVSFSNRSPFDDRENDLLYAMLSFCLCGHIKRAIDVGNKQAR